MIKQMNTDITDINNKLISIDNSINTSLVTDRFDTKRSIDYHYSHQIKNSKMYSINKTNPQFNPTNVNELPLNTKDKLKENVTNNSQLNLLEKDKKMKELERNREILLDKNKQLENQLVHLDKIINGQPYMKASQSSITETDNERELTESNMNRNNTNNTNNTTMNNNNNDNIENNCNDNQNTKNNVSYCLMKNDKTPYSKYNDYNSEIECNVGYDPMQPKGLRDKRSKSAKAMKLKKKKRTNKEYSNDYLLEENHNLKVKLNDLRQMLTFNHLPHRKIYSNRDKESDEYYLENQERKFFLEKLNSLEQKFNNQLRSLNNKYQYTIDKQDVKIQTLIKENEELKRKVKQVKVIMK